MGSYCELLVICGEWTQCKGVLRHFCRLAIRSMTDGNAGVREEFEEKDAR